jgi:cytochrome P450
VRDNPDLWENVFTEMMRYDPVVHMQGRRAKEEIAMYDEVIPKGAFVVIYLGAGNRDERVFKNPDTFDALRDDLHMGRENRSGRYKDGKPGHLGFGMGQHFCMGYAMARQEAVLASTYFAKELKGLRPKFKEHDGIYSPNIDSGGFRSPAELWLEFDVD